MLSKEKLAKLMEARAQEQILDPLRKKYPKVDTADMEASLKTLFSIIADSVVDTIRDDAVVRMTSSLEGSGTATVATPSGPATGTATVTINPGKAIGRVE